MRCLLFTHNLAVHRDTKGVKHAAGLDVDMMFLPPNTSHFTQPLDNLVFAIYKSELTRLASSLNRSLSAFGEKLENHSISVLTSVTVAAEAVAFRRDKIIASFANTIFPWDPNAILDRARRNIGTLTHQVIQF